jgi:hypothetical protein
MSAGMMELMVLSMDRITGSPFDRE